MHKKISLYFLIGCCSCLLIIVQPSFARDVSLMNNQILLTPTHGGDGSAWGQANCSACHVQRNIHKTVPKIRDIVFSTGYQGCTGCHGNNGALVERKCTICHNSERLPASPLQHAEKNHNFNVLENSKLSDTQCLVCHQAADMDGQFEPKVDLTHFTQPGVDMPYQNSSEFCLRCHNDDHQQPGFEMLPRILRDPLVMMDKNYRFIDKHGYPQGSGERTYAGLRESDYRYGTLVECTDCHVMHGTHNDKLIVDRSDAAMSKLPEALGNIPVLINVGENGNYAQLCVTCHAMSDIVEQGAEDAGNGLAGVHQIGTDCRTCHVHGMAAQTGL